MRNKANQEVREVAAWAVDLKEEEDDDLEDYLSDNQSYYGVGFQEMYMGIKVRFLQSR